MLVAVDYAYISAIESCSSRYQRGFRLAQFLSNMLYLPVTILVLQGCRLLPKDYLQSLFYPLRPLLCISVK